MMKRFLAGLLIGAVGSLVGCDSTPESGTASDPASEAANVEAETEDDEPGGLSIKLPEVEISVNKEEGVKVKAPGTDVSVSQEGIDITAPHAKIKTTPNKEETDE